MSGKSKPALQPGRQVERSEGTLRRRRLGGRSARVKAVVFQAAVQLLQAEGYEATTIAAIAKRASVHETTLYRRWGSREGVLMEALLAQAAAEIQMPDTGSLRSDLAQLVQEAVAFVRSPLGATMVQLSLSASPSVAFTQARQRYWQERFALADALFERAAARGELPAAQDPHLALEAVIGPIYLRLLLTGESLDESTIAQIVDLALTGIQGIHPR